MNAINVLICDIISIASSVISNVLTKSGTLTAISVTSALNALTEIGTLTAKSVTSVHTSTTTIVMHVVHALSDLSAIEL